MSWIAGSKLGTHGPNPVPIKSMPEHSLNENKPKLHYALGWIESGCDGSGSVHPKLNPYTTWHSSIQYCTTHVGWMWWHACDNPWPNLSR